MKFGRPAPIVEAEPADTLDACVTHGIEVYRRDAAGAMSARRRVLAQNRHPSVAQAKRSEYPALWVTFRTQAIESITDEVADFVIER